MSQSTQEKLIKIKQEINDIATSFDDDNYADLNHLFQSPSLNDGSIIAGEIVMSLDDITCEDVLRFVFKKLLHRHSNILAMKCYQNECSSQKVSNYYIECAQCDNFQLPRSQVLKLIVNLASKKQIKNIDDTAETSCHDKNAVDEEVYLYDDADPHTRDYNCMCQCDNSFKETKRTRLAALDPELTKQLNAVKCLIRNVFESFDRKVCMHVSQYHNKEQKQQQINKQNDVATNTLVKAINTRKIHVNCPLCNSSVVNMSDHLVKKHAIRDRNKRKHHMDMIRRTYTLLQNESEQQQTTPAVQSPLSPPKKRFKVTSVDNEKINNSSNDSAAMSPIPSPPLPKDNQNIDAINNTVSPHSATTQQQSNNPTTQQTILMANNLPSSSPHQMVSFSPNEQFVWNKLVDIERRLDKTIEDMNLLSTTVFNQLRSFSHVSHCINEELNNMRQYIGSFVKSNNDNNSVMKQNQQQ